MADLGTDLEVVAWIDGRLRILDQTRLPDEEAYLDLTGVDDVVDAIARLAVRGAPAIGGAGAYGMVVALDEARPSGVEEARAVLEAAAARIGAARPTAVNLPWAVRRVRDAAIGGTSVEEIRRLALDEAHAIVAEDREACAAIGAHGAELLADRHRILTHCNAGRLATLGIGTALGVVYAKAAAGHPVEVYAPETRPLLQGARLTAWELHRAGIPVTVLPDGAGATLLASGRVDAVVVGADRIAANGDVANKIGTFAHAVAAARAGVPFYVAAPRSTFDPATPDGDHIEIELRAPDELRGAPGRPGAPAEVAVWNPAFDVTPHELVTGIITDAGVLRGDYSAAIARLFEQI
ncbi:MAG TPA: S-methyl-5-thioribose-1-phosphate isomerase [Actinobacteria bacterium]|nr:S-methyl-5-thioribose-1-phosphate isomerase [Actinomycetota bacterium]